MVKVLIILALSVTNLFAISEIDYSKTFNNEVRPFIKSMGEGYFMSNGINIHYKTHFNNGAKFCMVILPGRSESAEKYGEFVYDLSKSSIGSNLNFFILSHRGQGMSDRMTDKLDMGYVDHFENYVSDLDYFLKNIVSKVTCQKKLMFAHSMGAAIGLSFVLDNPKFFDGLMISSPMLKIQTRPYPYSVAVAIVKSMMALGKGAEFAIGQGPFNPSDSFESNRFTSSLARFNMTMDLFNEYPKTKLGGVSNRWTSEVMTSTRKIRARYHKFKLPIHLYRAGTELYSEPEEMIEFCSKALQCQDMLLPSSKHEVVNDRDENRDLIISDIIDFIDHFKD